MNQCKVSLRMGACPTSADITAFVRGRCLDTDAEVEAHLSSCSHCMAMAEQLEDESDLVVQALAALPASDDDEAEFRRLQGELLSRPIDLAGDRLALNGASALRQMSTCDAEPLPERLGAYELLDAIGRGATGAVYRVRHLKLDRVFAMKVLHKKHSADVESSDRFLREMQAVGKLDHPHIVRATDAGEDQGYQYLVMEYSAGLDVSEVLRRLGPLSIADACEIARQAAAGLEHAHENGVVHRDVKPSNLLLTSEGKVKLLDLGLVAVRHGQSTAPLERNPRGTADYMAPEQWTDYAHVDHRADLYSLGCTLFKMLTGVAPFHSLPERFHSKMTAHLSAAVPKLSALRDDVPAELERLLARLFAKRPQDRYPSAAALANDLIPFARNANLQSIAIKMGLCPQGDNLLRSEPIAPGERTFSGRMGRRAAILGCAAAAASLAGVSLRRIWTPEPRMQTEVWRPLEPVSSELLLSLDQHATYTHNAADRSVLIGSDDYSLVDLGQPLTGVFSFRAAWKPLSSECRPGVFFRYRERREDRSPVHDFHLLELVPRAADGREYGVLQWSYLLVRGAAEKKLIERKLWAWTPAPDHAELLELEILLGKDGFPGIMWCGRRLPESTWMLTSDGRQKSQIASQRLRADYRGRLGVLVSNGAASFYRPQLMYH